MTMKEEAASIVNGLAQIVVPVYEDVAQPAAREIGKALQTVTKTIHVALAPVSAFVWGYEKIKDFICEKVAKKLKMSPLKTLLPRLRT